MILRTTSNWQTLTADLALILFLVAMTAAGNDLPDEEDAGSAQAANESTTDAPSSESALAVHRPVEGESIREWLNASVTDERQVVTISIRYVPERLAPAIAEGERLMNEAEEVGIAARLLAMPDTSNETVVTVDYHRNPENGTIVAG